MRYPRPVRAALGALPLGLELGGRRGRALVAALDRLFADSPERAQVRVAGAVLQLDLANPSERLLYYAPQNLLRTYRRSELHRVLRGLRGARGRVFVDVGANLGLYSLLARSLGLEPLLFEPEPAHLRHLQRNERAFGRVAGWALSDEEGSAELHVAGAANPGGSSLVEFAADREPLYVSRSTVELITFDTALERLGVDPDDIAFVKVDVEGNEERTVRGMAGFLARATAPIWCEVRGPGAARAPSSYRAVVPLLERHGYAPHRSIGGSARPFDEAGELPHVFDLLFLKRGTT